MITMQHCMMLLGGAVFVIGIISLFAQAQLFTIKDLLEEIRDEHKRQRKHEAK